ncbi:uncharacterized protein CXorf66 homolog [Peromyscus leucopus]|uniref:uncharacterized protein CXorf66 homolog n=1 Tax=Peromyscus leucopus TaxID=10041 RepID=UPI0018859FB1|nr:uncharacterized protein CXorf66 homolog [Peromyscus leucopus]
MAVNILIYALFLSIWTINCLERNKINVTSTLTTTITGDKTHGSTESKFDDFRERLLSFIVGLMIIVFTFTCFCFIYCNYMIKEVPSPGGLNKENMAAISSWVPKVSACKPDTKPEDILQTQPLLLN